MAKGLSPEVMARPARACRIDYEAMTIGPRGTYSENLWPGGVVYFEFDSNTDNAMRTAAFQVMSSFQLIAPIHFLPRDGEEDYIHIQNSDVNSSSVGRQDGGQIVNIFNWNVPVIIAHELMHALGIWHEQQRPDRDTFVRIETDNILPDELNNFLIAGTAHGPYDFDSAMHYGACDFSDCVICTPIDAGCRAITVLPPNESRQGTIGQRDHLSNGDMATLEFLYSPPPANDDCVNAIAITAPSTIWSTYTANDSTPPSCDSAPSAPDVWFTYTPTCSGTAVIDTCDSRMSDTILSVYRGGCGALVEVACSDDNPGCAAPLHSRVLVTMNGGETYRIRVAGYNLRGVGRLNITPPPGSNRFCTEALPVVAGTYPIHSTCGGPAGASPCDPGTDNPALWYWFFPACSGEVSVSTCGSHYDTVITVYSGFCGNQTVIACNNDSCGTRSQLTFEAVLGGTYFIRVSRRTGSSEDGSGTLSIFELDRPVNASCDTALTATLGSITFDTTCSPDDGVAASCGQASDAKAVWYSYTAPCDGTAVFHTCSSSYDTVISAYIGNCGSLIEIGCDDDGSPCGNNLSQLSMPVVSGIVYHLRVSGYGGAFGSGLFTVMGPAIPTNGSCAQAQTVGPGSTPFSTICAPPNGATLCADSTDSRSIWYRYVPACNGPVTVSTCDATFDTVLSAYTACNSAEIACNDDGCGVRSRIVINATGGQEYFIRVGGYFGATGTGHLLVEDLTPINSSCDSAVAIAAGTTSFSTVCAPANGAASCGNSNSSPAIWYVFSSPPCTGLTTIDSCGSGFDTVLTVYTDQCGSLTEIACNDDAQTGPCNQTRQSHVQFMAAAGALYYLRVSGFDSASGTGTLTVQNSFPANDSCATATPVADGSTPFSTHCAPMGAANACQDSANSPTLWYSYAAPCTGTAVAHTCASSYDTVLSAYSGDCNSLNTLACADDSPQCGGGPNAYIEFPVSAGEVYHIRVSGYDGASGSGFLVVACLDACPCDWNRSGSLTSQDFFDFVAAFFSADADFNRDGATTSQDFFDFIACFFAGCP